MGGGCNVLLLLCLPQSKATNVGLSQRVYIIGETCLNTFNRAQVGACQCERAVTNVEPHYRIWIYQPP